MLRAIIILFFIVSATVFQAQSFRGKVINSESKEGIFGVSIYYKGTSTGTLSGHEGSFDMRAIPGENVEVVFAKFGFASKVVKLITSEEILVQMEPNDGLSEMYEAKTKDRKWQRLYKRFEKALIGETDNAREVEVLNPEIIELTKNGDGGILGIINEPLQIRNNATGYQLYFFFNGEVSVDDRDAQYNGVPYFVELEPKSNEELKKWQDNRKLTYEGSLQHFMYALVSDQIKESGFEIALANRDPKSGKFISGANVSSEDLYKDGRLSFDNYLRIKYINEKPHNEFINSYSTTTRFGTRSRNGQAVENLFMENIPDRDGQVSYLFSRRKSLLIDSAGIMKNPEFLLEYGYWSWERIAELMPAEYHLEYIKTNQ